MHVEFITTIIDLSKDASTFISDLDVGLMVVDGGVQVH
jgi:hypothetical protein